MSLYSILLGISIITISRHYQAVAGFTLPGAFPFDYDAEVDVEVEDTLAHTVRVVAPPEFQDVVNVHVRPNSVVGFLETPPKQKSSSADTEFLVDVDNSNIHTLKVLLGSEDDQEPTVSVTGPEPTQHGTLQQVLPVVQPKNLLVTHQDIGLPQQMPVEESVPGSTVLVADDPFPSIPEVEPFLNLPSYDNFLDSFNKAMEEHNKILSESLSRVDPQAYNVVVQF